jgi:hypothetical protein
MQWILYDYYPSNALWSIKIHLSMVINSSAQLSGFWRLIKFYCICHSEMTSIKINELRLCNLLLIRKKHQHLLFFKTFKKLF